MKTEYEIGGKTYTRKELLEFGRRHYPKFYWIKRGIGIGLMSTFGLIVLFFVLYAYQFQQMYKDYHEEVYKYLAQSYYITAGVLSSGVIVGIVLFSMSFTPLPDESYIKHAVDYYTKKAANEQRFQARQENRQQRQDTSALERYKQLLDKGVITQEEYEAKKREILK